MVNRRAGFTLVELLVVVGILAITLPSVLMISTYTTNIRNEARLRSGATLLAEGKTEQLLGLLKTTSPTLPSQETFLPETGSPYSWKWRSQSEVSEFLVPVDPSDPSKGTVSASVPVTAILVTVKWSYRGQEQIVRAETYAR